VQAKKLLMNWLLANGEFSRSKTSTKRVSVAITSGRRFTSSPLPIIKDLIVPLLYLTPQVNFLSGTNARSISPFELEAKSDKSPLKRLRYGDCPTPTHS